MNLPQALQDFVENKIDAQKFGSEFNTAINFIEKNNKMSSEQSRTILTALQTYLPKIQLETFDMYTEEFLKFSLLICDHDIYTNFRTQKAQFQVNLQPDQKQSANEVVLYIISRLLEMQDKNQLILQLNIHRDQIKAPEKSLLLAEVYLCIIPQIKKIKLYGQVLPNILKSVNQVLTKYIKNRQKYSNFDEMQAHTKSFCMNFQEWITDFLMRSFIILSGLEIIQGENKRLPQFGDDAEANPQLFARHTIILYFLDAFQGIIEARGFTNLIDKEKIDQFFMLAKKVFLEKLVQSEHDLIDTLVRQLRYNIFYDHKQAEQIEEYQFSTRYNVVTCGHFLIELLQKKDFKMAFQLLYKAKILFIVSNEFFRIEKAKSEMKRDLAMLFADIFRNYKSEKLLQENYFDVSLPEVFVNYFELAGTYFEKNEQAEFIQSFQNLMNSFSQNVQFKLYKQMMNKDNNLNMIAFFMDEFRQKVKNQLAQNVKASQSNFVNKNEVFDLFFSLIKKNEIKSIFDRAELLTSIFLLIQFIIKLFINEYKNNQNQLEENHLLNKINKTWFKSTIEKHLKPVDQEISLAYNYQIKNEKKKDAENKIMDELPNEQDRENAKMQQLNLLKFNFDQLTDVLKEVDAL